jgi:hypothetical protein
VLRERFAYKMQAAEKDGKNFSSYAGSINLSPDTLAVEKQLETALSLCPRDIYRRA